jgi:hypothetical protein
MWEAKKKAVLKEKLYCALYKITVFFIGQEEQK